jgi:K+-sensing histidine kinase KdpD
MPDSAAFGGAKRRAAGAVLPRRSCAAAGHSGAGLGLTIAREIIHRAGGTISISNRAEGGLRQVVELPQAEAQM